MILWMAHIIFVIFYFQINNSAVTTRKPSSFINTTQTDILDIAVHLFSRNLTDDSVPTISSAIKSTDEIVAIVIGSVVAVSVVVILLVSIYFRRKISSWSVVRRKRKTIESSPTIKGRTVARQQQLQKSPKGRRSYVASTKTAPRSGILLNWHALRTRSRYPNSMSKSYRKSNNTVSLGTDTSTIRSFSFLFKLKIKSGVNKPPKKLSTSRQVTISTETALGPNAMSPRAIDYTTEGSSICSIEQMPINFMKSVARQQRRKRLSQKSKNKKYPEEHQNKK